MSNWTAAEAAFAEVMPGYEPRPEQTRLATTIEDGLLQGQRLLAQAGTGTGKSFAALVPAIGHAQATGEPVFVATATKALQGQYVGDLLFLQKTLPESFEFAVVKGRGNYVCQAKLAELTGDEVANLKGIREELAANPGHSGDLEGFATHVDMRDKPKMTSTSEECPGKSECPFGSICFAEAVKDKARQSDVVVINHSLLVMDLLVRQMSFNEEKGESTASILPMDFSGVVIDEAHELESFATNALGAEISTRSITGLVNEVAKFIDDPSRVTTTLAAGNTLFTALEQYRDRERSKKLGGNALLKYEDEFVGLIEALRELREIVRAVSVRGDDRKGTAKKRLNKRLSGQITKLEDLLTRPDTDLVRWLEEDVRAKGNGPKGALLKYAPLHVGPFLQANLWDRPAVLMSATLSTGTDFSYIAERLGLVRPRTFDAGTPFDYAKQAALFIPEGFDPTDSAKWRVQVALAMPKLIEAAGGRTLALFTSRSAMQDAHDAVADQLEDMGFTVLMQGEESNPILSAKFKADETSVLFAMKSFMTGFDVQGDALRLVIIDKLPYENPSDVIWAARCELVDRKAAGNWSRKAFMTMTIPAMLLTLLQGIGRLIRSKSDEGMVAILDSRIHSTKAYTRTIRAALPPARMIRDPREALDHLRELTSRRG